ncbi:GtrA family protein [Salinivibrio proteolyticus]|uniref:GtrA family protein n=1 Tax=Salinivibrio proteolyticus TaxID=334715 RepID=UPI0038CDC24E
MLLSKQFLKFSLVGMASNTVVYFTYLTVTYLGGTPKVTMTILYLCAVFISFSANAIWTFEYKSKKKKAFNRYIASHAVGYGVNFIILYLFVDVFLLEHQYVQAVSMIVVAIIIFTLNKCFVFKEK